MRLIYFLLVVVLLSGCASARGFWIGAAGGPLAVDEYVHDEVKIMEPEIHVKVAVHQGILISTAFVLWPFSAAYAGASGLYGVYKFHTEGK